MGADHEVLTHVEGHIATGYKLIDRQCALIVRLGKDGKDTEEARTLLVRLIKFQSLFESYRQTIIDKLDSNAR